MRKKRKEICDGSSQCMRNIQKRKKSENKITIFGKQVTEGN